MQESSLLIEGGVNYNFIAWNTGTLQPESSYKVTNAAIEKKNKNKHAVMFASTKIKKLINHNE